MVHCGGAKGFVPNALLMFKSGSKSDDYHDDMNHKKREITPKSGRKFSSCDR
jgi:hypothetical protein